MILLYNFATRSRPEKFKACVENIRSLSTLPYKILVKADFDDESMIDVPIAEDIIYAYGHSDSKIHAINRDIDKWDGWDILVNMSDDMVFTVKGFDQIIHDSFDNTDQFLHFPDGNVGDKLCTLSIIGRKYYERFNYVYHPSYKSLWCDNEAQEVAKSLNCYKYIDKQIFEHRHPAFGKAPNDAQYQKTESFYYADKANYELRKHYNFQTNV